MIQNEAMNTFSHLHFRNYYLYPGNNNYFPVYTFKYVLRYIYIYIVSL